MRRIFIDMDGVLATFHPEKSLEEISSPGYFASLEPQQNVVDAIRYIVRNAKDDTRLYILSSVLNDRAANEKMDWLKYYLPELSDQNSMLMVPYGENKSAFVKTITGEVKEDDILLDDFTKNLKSWHGVGIKLLNPINNTKKSWQGYVINGNGTASIIQCSLLAIASI